MISSHTVVPMEQSVQMMAKQRAIYQRNNHQSRHMSQEKFFL